MPSHGLVGRIISLTDGQESRPPLESLKKVKIDLYLMSMGLLSRPFGAKKVGSSHFWARSHQLFVLVLEWAMLIKWLSTSFIPPDIISPEQMGDFTVFLPHTGIDYQFVMILWSSIGAFSATLFTMARNHHKLNLLWLRPFELCKGTIKQHELNIEMDAAAGFWRHVLSTLSISLLIIRILIVLSVSVAIYIFLTYWPKQHLYSYGIVWLIITIIWLYYNISIELAIMTIFHTICYYFWIKFRKLNNSVKQLEGNHKLDLMAANQRINNYMINHNSYAKELALYNKFWQYYLVMDFTIYITTICYFIQVILFIKMVFLVKVIVLSAVCGLLFCLIFTAFSSGAVSEEIHEAYTVLNGVSQNQMPLVLKTQLQIYIQRIGGPVMGFSCWDLFTVTYDGFLQALLMIGSFFLLFMDVSQTEKKKRRFPNKSLDSSANPIVI